MLTSSSRSPMGRILPVLLALALLAPVACHKRKPPSPEYDKAVTMYGKLYGQKLDDAYVDPGMNDVEALLGKVSADTADYEAAQKMLHDIEENRARVEKERAERQQAVADATRPSTLPAGALPVEKPAEKPPEEEKPDAGVPVPIPGMPMEEFQHRFGTCFRQGDPIVVEGRGQRDIYELKDIANCRDRLPGFDQQIVIVEDGAVWRIAPISLIRKVTPLPDGGLPGPDEDAGSR